MEAAGVVIGGCTFLTREQIECFKIITDNAEHHYRSLKACDLTHAVNQHVPCLTDFIHQTLKASADDANHHAIEPITLPSWAEQAHWTQYRRTQWRMLSQQWRAQRDDEPDFQTAKNLRELIDIMQHGLENTAIDWEHNT